MSKALSVDLRVRVLQAVAAGASHREAEPSDGPLAVEREPADVRVGIDPDIFPLLRNREWKKAKETIDQRRKNLTASKEQRLDWDWLTVVHGQSWRQPYRRRQPDIG